MTTQPTPEQIEAERMSAFNLFYADDGLCSIVNKDAHEAVINTIAEAIATASLEGEAKGRELGLCEAAQIIDESDCPTRYILVAAILALKEKHDG